jgi:hypothetical protein
MANELSANYHKIGEPIVYIHPPPPPTLPFSLYVYVYDLYDSLYINIVVVKK